MQAEDTQQPAAKAALELRIDSAALAQNWKTLNRLSGNARAAAAVKADGYGLGARQVVPVLQQAGCEDFFVAHFSEAKAICGMVDPGRVSVLHGPLVPDDASYARSAGVKPVINSIAQAQRWITGGGGACDLMIDTGMNRLGLPLSDLANPAVRALEIDILMSHLASADQDVSLNSVQCGHWQEARQQVRHKRASLANSAGIALGSAYHGDLTRPGLSLYGGVPRPELQGQIAQVARPFAAILQTREIAAGEAVGYNSTFIARQTMRIGTVAIGYADGYLRCWSGEGRFLAKGIPMPVLGRVSMDMTIIDLSAVPELQEGDWVEAEYSLPHASAATGLSQYELLTMLGQRFRRIL